ncbi:transposase [Streptomyces malaysiensis]|nr:transposase [Streptomyces malaysiensis]
MGPRPPTHHIRLTPSRRSPDAAIFHPAITDAAVARSVEDGSPAPGRSLHHLDMLDTLAGWGMRPPVVVADAAYGTNAHLRAGLAERGTDYILAVPADVTAHPFDAQPTAPDRKGLVDCWPQPRYRHPAPSVAALAASLGQEAFTSLTWRQGSRGELRSRFAAMRVRPAGNAVERPIRAAASAEQVWWDGILPDCWLLVERPEEAEAPTDYWLSNLLAAHLFWRDRSRYPARARLCRRAWSDRDREELLGRGSSRSRTQPPHAVG